METEGKQILVDYLTDIADTFRSITGETDTIGARTYPAEIEKVAGDSSSKNSYQRSSVEEMNAITDASNGDRCLILKESVKKITEDGKIRRLSFPLQVVMESPIKQFYIAVLETEEGSYGDINLSYGDFTFSLTDSSSSVNVTYSSSDGITYNRDTLSASGNFIKVDENTIDFGTDVLISDTNEYVGAFLLETVVICDGIYVKNDTDWSVQGLGYEISPENVEASIRYYNNGMQVGTLGNTASLKEIMRLNDFITNYGTKVVYPEDMQNAFRDYMEEKIPLLELSSDTSNVTNMAYMFNNCRTLKSIPPIDTSRVTNMHGMFYYCQALPEIPSLNTSKVTNMDSMFNNCSSLKTIPYLDTSKVTNMAGMFNGCYSLETIPELDASSVQSTWALFSTGVVKPFVTESFGGLKNLGKSFSVNEAADNHTYQLRLDSLTNLTHDSLMNVINNLYDIKSIGVKPQTLQLGDTNKAKLTAEEIAIATNKGWNVK